MAEAVWVGLALCYLLYLFSRSGAKSRISGEFDFMGISEKVVSQVPPKCRAGNTHAKFVKKEELRV